MEAAAAYRTSSITMDRGDGSVRTLEPGDEDVELARSEARLAVERLLTTLPERERKILELRFFQDMSQSDIAAIVGTSQVHVSRLIRASLAALREHVIHEPAMADVPQGDRQR
jgi:RNA polymerase sigma-B factor